MARDLAPGVWFVRSNGGSGSYPVTPEGWSVVRSFVIGVVATCAASILVAIFGSPWLWPVVFAAGMAWSAWRFIDAARRHTDYSITYNDYLKDRKNA